MLFSNYIRYVSSSICQQTIRHSHDVELLTPCVETYKLGKLQPGSSQFIALILYAVVQPGCPIQNQYNVLITTQLLPHLILYLYSIQSQFHRATWRNFIIRTPSR